MEAEQPQHLSLRVYELEETWTQRTGYRFSDEDKLSADTLVRAHGYAVVQVVLTNTLYTRPKSKKWRWNNFQVFARNWEINREAYRSWCVDNAQIAVERFDSIPEATDKTYNEYRDWFKEHCKKGGWEMTSEETRSLGISRRELFPVFFHLVEDGLQVTKEEFLALIDQSQGLAPLAKAATE